MKTMYSERLYTVPGRSETETETVAKTVLATKTIKVVDDAGTPLPGAHIYDSAGNGSTTDVNGVATITETVGNINISFLGFKTLSYPFSAIPEVVQMQSAKTELDPVIVTAKKKSYFWPAVGIATAIGLALATGNQPQEVTL